MCLTHSSKLSDLGWWYQRGHVVKDQGGQLLDKKTPTDKRVMLCEPFLLTQKLPPSNTSQTVVPTPCFSSISVHLQPDNVESDF